GREGREVRRRAPGAGRPGGGVAGGDARGPAAGGPRRHAEGRGAARGGRRTAGRRGPERAARAAVGGGGEPASRPALGAGDAMKGTHALETLLVRAIQGGVRAMSWRASLGMGAAVGELALGLGLRREVGLVNLAIAFPERTPEARAEILRRHYRQLGQGPGEDARLAELSAAPVGEVIALGRRLQPVGPPRPLGRGGV